jgi:hypothetical protein
VPPGGSVVRRQRITPGRRAAPTRTALDRDLVELGRRHDRGAGAMDWEYLLFTARKAG